MAGCGSQPDPTPIREAEHAKAGPINSGKKSQPKRRQIKQQQDQLAEWRRRAKAVGLRSRWLLFVGLSWAWSWPWLLALQWAVALAATRSFNRPKHLPTGRRSHE